MVMTFRLQHQVLKISLLGRSILPTGVGGIVSIVDNVN